MAKIDGIDATEDRAHAVAMAPTFKPGDGVSWGFNGDVDPGTVVRVTRSRVFVRRDKVSFARPVEYGETPECTFSPDPEGSLETFTFRAPGAYRRMGNRTGWTLGHGRAWSRNPSF